MFQLRKARQTHLFFHDDFPRTRVYEELFKRPTGIVPSVIRLKRGSQVLRGKGNYKYQFNGSRQRKEEEDGLPKYNGRSMQSVVVTWSSYPTKEQITAIYNQNYSIDNVEETRYLAPYFDKEINTKVIPYIVNRGVHGYLIVNRARVVTTGFYGIQFLATCQQVNAEGSKILYGKNQFIFDSCPSAYPDGLHEYNALEHLPYLIPGLSSPDGKPMSESEIKYAVKRLFQKFLTTKMVGGKKVLVQKPAKLPVFDEWDAMAYFFRFIGRSNASHITSVAIEGKYKTAENNPARIHKAPIGLDTILGIQITVLKYACPVLTSLTIHQREGYDLWASDLKNNAGQSDSIRISESVEKVVLALPSLADLQLGNYQFAPKFNSKVLEKPWGSAVKWVAFVQDRHEKFLAKVAEYKLAADNRLRDRAAEEEAARRPGKVDESAFPVLGGGRQKR